MNEAQPKGKFHKRTMLAESLNFKESSIPFISENVNVKSAIPSIGVDWLSLYVL